jgi:hypothetical protein
LKRIGVTGHQLIPVQEASFVHDAIAMLLSTSSPLEVIGITSLAAGADQIFAKAVLEQGGKLKAVVPCARYEDAFTDHSARYEYFRLLAQASDREILPYSGPSDEAFLAAGKRVVEISDLIVAIWDGRPAKGRGGTADAVAYARDNNKDVVIIWPQGVER